MKSDGIGGNTWSTCSKNGNKTTKINVKNFHGSLTTVVRAQNDTTKTANITDGVLLIKDVLSVIESANLRRRQNLKQK